MRTHTRTNRQSAFAVVHFTFNPCPFSTANLTRAPIVINSDHTPNLTPKFTLNLLVISSIKTILSDIHIKADS